MTPGGGKIQGQHGRRHAT